MIKSKETFFIIISFVALSVSIITYIRTEELSRIHTLPRLSTVISGQPYVGRLEGRSDEVVTIPVIVFNNSNTFAYKIILDLLISDGTGRQFSLNEHLRSINVAVNYKESLSPGEQWILPTFSISSAVNSRENYAKGRYKFKVRLQLTWIDREGREYNFVNLEELKYLLIKELGVFWFESKGAFSSLDNKRVLKQNWGMNFNY